MFYWKMLLFNIEKSLFDKETQLFDKETQLFDKETRLFDLEMQLFDWETRLFDWETRLFDWEMQLFDLETRLFIKHRGLLVEKRLSLIAFLSAIYKIRVAKPSHFGVLIPSGFLPASRANDFLYREVVLPEKLLVLDRLVHGNLFRLEL